MRPATGRAFTACRWPREAAGRDQETALYLLEVLGIERWELWQNRHQPGDQVKRIYLVSKYSGSQSPVRHANTKILSG